MLSKFSLSLFEPRAVDSIQGHIESSFSHSKSIESPLPYPVHLIKMLSVSLHFQCNVYSFYHEEIVYLNHLNLV